MGTNYYLTEKPPCECCGREYEQLHIGKSSAGWTFALHVADPDDDCPVVPRDLLGWRELLGGPGAIKDEYGRELSSSQMIDVIANRGRKERPVSVFTLQPYGASKVAFLRQNDAEWGPNNLLRRKIDGRHCIGHGSGTWDLVIGYFS